MRGLAGRVTANLLWLVLLGTAIVIGAFLSYATGVLFDDSYAVTVPMPEAGGVLPEQEVTVLGRAVGQVDDVAIVDEGVLLTLRIQGSRQVPRDATVQVLRRSPIGEQAVDFQPTDADWEPAEPGARIVPVEAIIPAEIPALLENARELFAAIEVDDVATIFQELALALDGRGETLKQLNRDSLELNRTLVDGIPEFERLIIESEVVLATLRDHREALAEGFTSGADLTELLADEAPVFEALLSPGTRALQQFDAFIRNERANFSCLIDDFQAINDMLLGPSTFDGAEQGRYQSKLHEAEMALVNNRFFFQQGFWIITQPDPTTGADWQRINFTLDPAGGQAYPEKRATPATRPGAACETDAWGTGVNAVRQDDPAPPDATSPGIDYAPMAAESGGRTVSPPAAPDDDGGPPLPATGGGLLAAPILLVIGLALRGRRR